MLLTLLSIIDPYWTISYSSVGKPVPHLKEKCDRKLKASSILPQQERTTAICVVPPISRYFPFCVVENVDAGIIGREFSLEIQRCKNDYT